jgi:hypothetical protein
MNGTITDDQAHAWLQDIADAGWISLHYDNPGLGDENLAEIYGGGYLRYKMAFSPPANRGIWSLYDARFTGLNQTKLVYFGIWTNQHKGWLRAYGELPRAKVVTNGGGYVIPQGELAISIG